MILSPMAVDPSASRWVIISCGFFCKSQKTGSEIPVLSKCLESGGVGSNSGGPELAEGLRLNEKAVNWEMVFFISNTGR